MNFLMTNDVEETSITGNELNRHAAQKVSEKGLPSVLDLYSKYDIESTFYFTGTFASTYPKSVELVHESGHEVGCHGYSHLWNHSFDVLPINSQYAHLNKAKSIIEQNIGSIEAFRAPALRIGNQTPRVLEELGFRTDSSISSQRFDGPLTSGAMKKLNWLFTPRHPYYMDINNPFKVGSSKILEIPVSAFVFGYQGSTMRAAPKLNSLIGNFLFSESKRKKTPVVFLHHPNEVIDEKLPNKYSRRSKSFFGHLFSDVLRRKFKLKNLGSSSLKLLESVLKEAKDNNFEFVTAQTFRKNFDGS